MDEDKYDFNHKYVRTFINLGNEKYIYILFYDDQSDYNYYSTNLLSVANCYLYEINLIKKVYVAGRNNNYKIYFSLKDQCIGNPYELEISLLPFNDENFYC
jgi:hypothetical protein